MSSSIEKRLAELGIELPEASKPVANYVPYHLLDNQLYISGQLPLGAEGLCFAGKVGETATVEDAAKAAKLCAINILAQAKAATGNLDNIRQVLKLTGFVNCTPDFTNHPAVINGASDFLVEVLGEKGKHTRSAVGSSSLPMGASVEIEAIILVNPQ